MQESDKQVELIYSAADCAHLPQPTLKTVEVVSCKTKSAKLFDPAAFVCCNCGGEPLQAQNWEITGRSLL